ncbi:MerR family transcriptional regulator [Lactiplantibacillus nangangensis]|uniref:MerR family transcriptional regulator n=1 Tax=Lactiplantibacillus nangangensis TaxID=2559917 RepID=A0ABW1SKF0_9LACO|nr:MerR family transcriptional regulator [Lactiplantibacillus nangangensis]
MSQYTTGELAKLAQVSVRTIQYYDQRQLLMPSAKSEGGRRLYSVADLNRLKLILLLKQLGLSLKSIQAVLASPEAPKVLRLLLVEQANVLQKQVDTTQQQLSQIEQLQRGLTDLTNLPINSITDIDQLMTNQQGLSRIHRQLLLWSIGIDVIEIGTLTWGIVNGQWWPFIIGLAIVVLGVAWLTHHYFQTVNYVCPNCQTSFVPHYWQAVFARHTPKTRKLTCPQCHGRYFCVEHYGR